MVKHSQSSQESKFAISLQYLEKKIRNEVEFLHADKHQNLLQVDCENFEHQIFLQGDIIINDGHD